MAFLTNLLAAMAPKLLDWILIKGGNVVSYVALKYKQFNEGAKERKALDRQSNKYQKAVAAYKKSLEEKESKQLQDTKKRAMNDAFKEFIRFRPTKF